MLQFGAQVVVYLCCTWIHTVYCYRSKCWKKYDMDYTVIKHALQ